MFQHDCALDQFETTSNQVKKANSKMLLKCVAGANSIDCTSYTQQMYNCALFYAQDAYGAYSPQCVSVLCDPNCVWEAQNFLIGANHIHARATTRGQQSRVRTVPFNAA